MYSHCSHWVYQPQQELPHNLETFYRQFGFLSVTGTSSYTVIEKYTGQQTVGYILRSPIWKNIIKFDPSSKNFRNKHNILHNRGTFALAGWEKII